MHNEDKSIALETKMSDPFPEDGFTPSKHVLINGIPYGVISAHSRGSSAGKTSYVRVVPVSFTVKLEPGEKLEYITEWAWEG